MLGNSGAVVGHADVHEVVAVGREGHAGRVAVVVLDGVRQEFADRQPEPGVDLGVRIDGGLEDGLGVLRAGALEFRVEEVVEGRGVRVVLPEHALDDAGLLADR